MGKHRAAVYDVAWKAAQERLADHVITTLTHDEHVQLYSCRKPGTSTYSFFVVFTPHAITIYGDIGELHLQPGQDRGMGWLRGSVKSTGYLLEKSKPHNPNHFYADEAREWLQEMIDAKPITADVEGGPGVGEDEDLDAELAANPEYDGPLTPSQAQEVLYAFDDRESGEALYDALVDAGMSDCGEQVGMFYGYPPEHFWIAACLRWFVEHLPKEEAAPPPA